MNHSDCLIYRICLQNTDVGTVEHHKKSPHLLTLTSTSICLLSNWSLSCLWGKHCVTMSSGFMKAPQKSRVIHYRLLKVFWIHAKALNLKWYVGYCNPIALGCHLCTCISKLLTRLVWTLTANDIWHVCSYCMALEEYSNVLHWFCDPQMKRKSNGFKRMWKWVEKKHTFTYNMEKVLVLNLWLYKVCFVTSYTRIKGDTVNNSNAVFNCGVFKALKCYLGPVALTAYS